MQLVWLDDLKFNVLQMKYLLTTIIISLSINAVLAQSSRVYISTQGDTVVIGYNEKIFTQTEVAPKFLGGGTAWKKFLQQYLVYPEKARNKKIEGTVVLQFMVDKWGRVFEISAISGNEILADAAIKTMRNSPNWVPAEQNGRLVVVYAKQPFYFKIEE